MKTIALLSLCVLKLSLAGNVGRAAPVHFQPYSYDHEGKQIDGELGRLSVPEKHDNSNGRKITIAFLRLKSTSSHPGPPIIYLAGGPGGSGVNLAKGPRGSVFLSMRAAGDVIALDQRGAGLSEPNLTCPGALDFPLTSAGDFTPMLERLVDRSHSCASFWRDRGVDLTAYNVVENAGDLESLRQALGVKKISLWGSSYGTHLALAVIRHHGEHIHRAVLAGVEGPDHTLKLPSAAEQQLKVLGKLVASNPDLNRDIPDLVSLVRRVFATAERKPFTIAVIDPESKKTTTVTLGRFDLEQTVISMLGDREGLERLPRMFLAFERADLSSPLVQMAARLAVEDRTGPIGSAMSFAMDCASGASKERIARIERETRAGLLGHVDFPFPEICSAWGVPELPPSERTLVRSNLPVLFISGTLDGRTPPSNAEEAQRGFPNSDHVLIEGAGHGHDLFVSSPEIRTLMVEFMKTGKVITRRIHLPPLQFH